MHSVSDIGICHLGRSGLYQCVLFPYYSLVLVRIGVREALDLSSLAPEESVKIWPNLVALALFQVVALRASCLNSWSEPVRIPSAAVSSSQLALP